LVRFEAVSAHIEPGREGPFRLIRSALEITMSKIWASSRVITVSAAAAAISLELSYGLPALPVRRSVPLFVRGVAIYLFFATSDQRLPGDDCTLDAAARLLYILVAMRRNVLPSSNTAPRIQAIDPEQNHGVLALKPFHFVRPIEPVPRERIFNRMAAISIHRGLGFDADQRPTPPTYLQASNII
jgi:hypothetical protein